MAAPNIVSVTSIYGKTVYDTDISTDDDVLLENAVGSNKLLKVNSLIPPQEEIYWSCLPMGSLRMSISISHAFSASWSGVSLVQLMYDIPFIRAVVKEPEEPNPVPAGISAKLVISMFDPSG